MIEKIERLTNSMHLSFYHITPSFFSSQTSVDLKHKIYLNVVPFCVLSPPNTTSLLPYRSLTWTIYRLAKSKSGVPQVFFEYGYKWKYSKCMREIANDFVVSNSTSILLAEWGVKWSDNENRAVFSWAGLRGPTKYHDHITELFSVLFGCFSSSFLLAYSEKRRHCY